MGDGVKLDIWGSFLIAELALLADHHAGVDPPGLAVFLAIFVGVELEDGNTCLFAVAGGQTKILDSGFVAAIWASIDPSAGEALGEGVGVERCTTADTISHVFSSEF